MLAVLAMIGGVDNRPRLGGLVQHETFGVGTVSKITPKGKIHVQFHESPSQVCRRLHQHRPLGWAQGLVARRQSRTHQSTLHRQGVPRSADYHTNLLVFDFEICFCCVAAFT